MRAAILFLCTAVAFAIEGMQVEVILFENLAADNSVLNDHLIPGVPVMTDAKFITNNKREPVHFVNQSEFMLGGEMARLRKSKSYRPLAHFSWQQPKMKQNDAQTLAVNLGRTFEIPKQASFGQFIPNFSPTLNTDSIPEITGTIRMSQGRFGHFECDLLVHKALHESGDDLQSADETVEAKVVKAFRLKHKRRLKAQELVYLDHPLYGLLVKFKPVTLPDEAMLEEEELFEAVPSARD